MRIKQRRLRLRAATGRIVKRKGRKKNERMMTFRRRRGWQMIRRERRNSLRRS